MAITGIDTIEGKQIIAAGAVSAKSAEMAYNDENGNPITGYQVAGDYLTTADSANFYTTANESGYITGIPDTYLQNTDLSTTDGKVTAISGIPLSAGGDVPEGVMVESGLEYNAVNEISAYNGSAIAQYGAEKQWLVHDDTLVHAANSAQYALGVNLSAVAQLLGIDETVLWSGEPQKAPITLSESYKNFKELKIVGRLNDSNAVGTVASWRFDTDIISANPYLNCQSFVANSTGNSAYGAYLRNSVEVVSSDTGIGHWHTYSYSYSTANQITMQSNDEWGKLFYYKVIGIGRKEV